MAETILKIKRSGTSGNPSKLRVGELAYSWAEGAGGNRLYIGTGTEMDGNASNHAVIGGTYFTNMLDHTAGTLTAGSAIIVGSDKKVNEIITPHVHNDGELVIEGTKTVLKNAYIGDNSTTIQDFVDGRIGTVSVKVEAGTGISVTGDGTTKTIALTDTGVVAGSVGSSTAIPVLTIDAQGRITKKDTATISTTLTLGDGASGSGSVALNGGKLEIAKGTGATVSLTGGKFTVGVDTNTISTKEFATSEANRAGGEALSSAKEYAGQQDATTLQSAKSYADEQDGTTLQSAKDYADEQDATNLASAKGYADTKKTEAITSANKYTDEQIPAKISGEIGKTVQAHSAQLDKVAALASEGLVKRGADGSITAVKSSVGSGSYTKVTVDANGIVTAGSNPTTVAGYGITDAVKTTGSTMTGRITTSGVDVSSFGTKDLVTREFVEHVASGHIPHKACRTGSKENIVGTYSNGTSGVGATFTTSTKTIGGVTVAEQDRVILLGQSKGAENGVYVVTSASASVVLTRAEDLDGSPSEEIYQGSSFLVVDGTLQGTIWTLMNKTITFGTTAIEWAQTAAPSVYTGGSGISVSGNSISVKEGTTVKVIGGNLEVASGNSNQGKVLVAGGNGTSASWKQLAPSDISGTVPVSQGGTGATTLSANQLVVGNGTSAVKSVANADGVLVGSTSGAPTFGKADLTKHVSGVLPASNGGTGVANSNTLTLTGGNITLTASGATNVTLPTSGTVATLAGAETLSNKTISAKNITVTDATDSSSASTGAVKVSGGVGIAKNVNVGGNITGSGTSVLSGFVLDGGEY